MPGESRIYQFSHMAMATRFEMHLVHSDAAEAAMAARAVWDDMDGLEQEISRYVPHSDISRINGSPAGREVMVREATMDIVSFGREIWEQTQGAFDLTIGPLAAVLIWPNGFAREPSPAELAAAKARCGYQHLVIDPEEFLIIPQVADMLLDPGAIGKGYALDQAANLLKEDWGIANFLLNAGTSTLLASGTMPEREGWSVRAGSPEPFLLKDEALSGTGFEVKGAHVIDPRTTSLVDIRRVIRWAVAPGGALADALSTAFMVMDRKEIAAFCAGYPGIRPIFYEG
ncbi:MAG: ApbE family lipoprotein [Verrucomicrobiales bacterium]|nr:ApbE family lipoprotein [Verrucomicrobiales bacterium]